MYGFPLNMPFIDADKIWQEVKNTELHLIEDETVEFAIAVEFFDFPHNILSVWVFICAIYSESEFS